MFVLMESTDKMAKVTVTAFIEEDLKEGLKALADKERRSMSQVVALLIERAVEAAQRSGEISAGSEGQDL
jgi:predicted transcriptional regulator